MVHDVAGCNIFFFHNKHPESLTSKKREMIISCIACFATFFPRNVRKQFPILDDFPVLCCNLFATNVTCVQSFSWLPWHPHTPFLFHVQLFFLKKLVVAIKLSIHLFFLLAVVCVFGTRKIKKSTAMLR